MHSLMYYGINIKTMIKKDLGGLFADLLVLEGIDPEEFHRIVGSLMNSNCLKKVRIEIAGSENTYPIHPGRLVLVGDYDNNDNLVGDAGQLFGELSKRTGLTFNDTAHNEDLKHPMYSAYVKGRINSADGSDKGCLLVVVKKLEEIV